MLTLPAFKEVNFTVVERDGAPWITAADLARALGYAREDNVAQIHRRNEDEFTDQMTAIVRDSPQRQFDVVGKAGVSNLTIRIFSLRGAHLVAMFSRTPVAKEFRRWVLDVLEHYRTGPVDPPAPPGPAVMVMDMDHRQLNTYLTMARDARSIWGIRTARVIWLRCGLPVALEDARGPAVDDATEATLSAWLVGRIACTAQEAARGIGIDAPTAAHRMQIAGALRAMGWVARRARLNGESVNAWFSPDGKPWQGIHFEEDAA